MIENTVKYGPNGEAVAALIGRSETLTPGQFRNLETAWNVAGNAAWDVAVSIAWGAGRFAECNSATYAARDAVGDAASVTVNARYAVEDAATALVVRDLISEDHFNTLYGPWASVMGAGK